MKFFPNSYSADGVPGWSRGSLDVHRARPADLLLVTCAPYVNLAAALRLWEEHKVPYAVDYRDGWSVDVIGGGEAFTRESAAGVWEDKVLRAATCLWVVNEPIAEFYRERYPDLANRVRSCATASIRTACLNQQPEAAGPRPRLRLPRHGEPRPAPCGRCGWLAGGRGATRWSPAPASRSRPHRRGRAA